MHKNTIVHQNKRMKKRREIVENLLKTFQDKLLSTETEKVIEVIEVILFVTHLSI